MPAQIRAAGAVPWRRGAAGLEVAVIHRPRYDDWSFPKGKCQPGEYLPLAAVREVAEETGLAVRLGRRLRPACYHSKGKLKRVDYWAGAAAPGEPARFVPGAEADELRWLPAAVAAEHLSYPHDRALLAELLAGPVDTVPVILARHAVARSRESWRADGHTGDLSRPLTRKGRAQATALGQLLLCYRPTLVISSQAERCLATVRPYAALAGTEVTPEPAFTIDGAPPGGTARQRIISMVSDGQPAVVCGHGENLPSLLAWACQQLGSAVPAGPPLRKGAFWVLQAGPGGLASAEQHETG